MKESSNLNRWRVYAFGFGIAFMMVFMRLLRIRSPLAYVALLTVVVVVGSVALSFAIQSGRKLSNVARHGGEVSRRVERLREWMITSGNLPGVDAEPQLSEALVAYGNASRKSAWTHRLAIPFAGATAFATFVGVAALAESHDTSAQVVLGLGLLTFLIAVSIRGTNYARDDSFHSCARAIVVLTKTAEVSSVARGATSVEVVGGEVKGTLEQGENTRARLSLSLPIDGFSATLVSAQDPSRATRGVLFFHAPFDEAIAVDATDASRSQVVACLSPRVRARVALPIIRGATIVDGRLVSEVDLSDAKALARLEQSVKDANELARSMRRVLNAEPGAFLHNRELDCCSAEEVESLAHALQKGDTSRRTQIAPFWAADPVTGRSQGRLLPYVAPRRRLELARELVTSEFVEVRADAALGLAVDEPSAFRDALRKGFEDDDVSFVDALADTAHRWGASAHYWAKELVALKHDTPSWARVALARMLIAAGGSDNRKQALQYLQADVSESRGRVLDHLDAMLADPSLSDMEPLLRGVRELIQSAISSRAGGLAVSVGADAGTLGLVDEDGLESAR